jgi:predicted O-methyltransferase YrrM
MAAVRADCYSPIVDPAVLPPEIWEQPAAMPGLELDLDGQLGRLEHRLSPLFPEFSPAAGFQLGNPWYGPMDAYVLYAMVRFLNPARVLELGSGYSTLVIQGALAESARHEVVDPAPSPVLTNVSARVTVHTESAARVSEGLVGALEPSDILFVDTSHTIKPGGEVTRIVLELLPALKPGVVVHFHDFFRPFEYPRVLYERFNVHWQEHYLVQAFLAYNPGFEVLCANHALWRLRGEPVKALLGQAGEGTVPSALWLQVTEHLP